MTALPDGFEALLFSHAPGDAQRALALAKTASLSLDAVADIMAVGLFSDDAAVRKDARALLSSCGHTAVEDYFKADKRNVHSLTDNAKMLKVAKDFAALGVDPVRFTRSRVRSLATNPAAYPYMVTPALHAALAFPGDEDALFALLSTAAEVFLPPPKKTLPPGLSKLSSLKLLRIPEGTVTTAKNVAELAKIPQRIDLQLWVKNVDLSLFASAAENVRGLFLRGPFSGVSDIAPLRAWKNLESLDIAGTGVTDLSALEDLPLRWLSIGDLKVTDLSVLKRFSAMTYLCARRVPAQDLSPIFALTELEHLELGFTCANDLSGLAGMTRLRTLDLWGVSVKSLEPLVGLPLESLSINYAPRPDLSPLARVPTLKTLSIVGAHPDHLRGFDAVRAALPTLNVVM